MVPEERCCAESSLSVSDVGLYTLRVSSYSPLLAFLFIAEDYSNLFRSGEVFL